MNVAEKVSLKLKAIADVIQTMIDDIAGEKIGFTLIVYTPGRASYVSNVKRDESIIEMKRLIEIWESGEPDIPAHKGN